MLAMSSPNTCLPAFVWPDDHMIRSFNINHMMMVETSDLFPRFSSNSSLSTADLDFDQDRDTSPNSAGDSKAAKKLSHNANERLRRKRINHMYSYLRSLLPWTDHKKKMSIPATITQVIKYIPELEQAVRRLIKKKEELLLRIGMQGGNEMRRTQNSSRLDGNINVSASEIRKGEVMVQISSRNRQLSLCEILLVLEQDGLVLLNASSSQASCGELFYHLHLKVGRSSRLMECNQLSRKLETILYHQGKHELYDVPYF